MKHLVAGLFRDSEQAGQAIGKLKEKGYTDDISIIAKDVNEAGSNVHQIKQDASDGTAAGAATGGVLGAVAGLLTAAIPVALPGIGLLIGGPLAALLGAAGGALTGGLVGAMVDLGIPDQKAKMFEDAVRAGEVLVTISVGDDKVNEVYEILQMHGAHEAGDIKLTNEM